MFKVLNVFGLAAILAVGFWFVLPMAEGSDKTQKKAVETELTKFYSPYVV
jgi:hypothetical protein